MRYLLLLFLFFSILKPLISQNPEPDTVFVQTVLLQVEKFFKAGIEKNYEEYVKYLNPVWMDHLGGKEAVIGELRRQNESYIYKKMLGGEPKVLDYKFYPPREFVTTKSSIQCAFKFKINVELKGKTKSHKSFMIGTSRDGGINWFFIDTLNKKLKDLKKKFPYLSENLKFK